MSRMGKITHIVQHYSATYEDEDIGLAEIREWHMIRKPPFKREGYHFIIRLDGTVEKGRPLTMVGAHVGGQNQGKIGICVVGGLKRGHGNKVGFDTRTKAQLIAQEKLIWELLEKFPGAEVVGHKDLAATLCPGYDVPTWWQSVIERKEKEKNGNPWAALVAFVQGLAQLFKGRGTS